MILEIRAFCTWKQMICGSGTCDAERLGGSVHLDGGYDSIL